MKKKALFEQVESLKKELHKANARLINNTDGLFINTIGGSLLDNTLLEYDKKTIFNRFIWAGLPCLDSMRFEERLYEKGYLALVKFNDNYYIQPFVMVDGINENGDVNKIQLTPYATTITQKIKFVEDDNNLKIDKDTSDKYKSELYSKVFEVGKNAVLIYTNSRSNTGVCSSEHELTQPYRDLMLKCFANLDTNITMANIRYIYQTDDLRADLNYKAIIDAVNDNRPVLALQKDKLNDLTLQEGQSLETTEIMHAIGELHAFKMFTLGIMSKHFGQDRGGRVSVGDMMGTEEQVNLVTTTNLYYREMFAKQANLVFGLNIQVENFERPKNLDKNGQSIENKEAQKLDGTERGLTHEI